MTDKRFEPYWTQTDEGCFDFLGRIGNKNMICRICGKSFEKELGDGNEHVLIDTDDLEEHYKSVHSDFIQRNDLEFHTGLRIPCSTELPLYDNPHLMIVHESTHKPPATEQEPYFHVYILRPKKPKNAGAPLAPPISSFKSSWISIYKNVGDARLGEFLIKDLEALTKAGYDLKNNVRLAIYRNKIGNWTISQKTHLPDMEDEEHLFNESVDGEERVE
jgi:hypothetical protein